MQKTEKINGNGLYMGISILFVLMAVVPLLIACCYAVPSADDFYAARNVRNLKEEGLPALIVAGKGMISFYRNQQGTFIGIFLYYLFSAWTRVRLLPTRIILFVIVAIFLWALYFCTDCVLKRILHGGGVKFTVNFVYGLMLYIITADHNVREVFYWISGTFIYTVPLFFMFIGIAFTIRALEEKRKADIVTACVMCFLSTGGTLQIAAFTNAIILGIGIWVYRRSRKLVILPMFLSALSGAVINVVAPGNYVRQNGIGAELNVAFAIKNSAIAVATAYKDLLENSPLLLLAIIFIVIGRKQIYMQIRDAIGIILYGILGLIIIDFPVLLAYGHIYLEPRVLFVQNVAIVVATLFFSICIGQILALILKDDILSKRFVQSMLGAVIFILIVLSGIVEYRNRGIIQIEICRNLADGSMKKWDDIHKEIFDILSEGKNRNVIIEHYPSDMGILKPMELSADPDNWVNTGIAGYYGCDSIILND